LLDLLAFGVVALSALRLRRGAGGFIDVARPFYAGDTCWLLRGVSHGVQSEPQALPCDRQIAQVREPLNNAPFRLIGRAPDCGTFSAFYPP